MSRACILQNLSFLIRTIPSVLEFLKRSPAQPLSRVMDYTIGRDSHPATKTFNIKLSEFLQANLICCCHYTRYIGICKE